MSMFANVTAAPQPHNDNARTISLFYAGILVVFAVSQLFTFDEFMELIASYSLPVSNEWSYALAPLLVVSEIFALPFLLRMSLSVAFRWLSMVLGWLAAGIWLFINSWVVITQPATAANGFLGSVGNLPSGGWAVCVALALCILAAWSSWGQWPGQRTNRTDS